MQQGHYFWELWRKLFLLFLVFSGLRFLFYVFNQDTFAGAPATDVLMALVSGLRFDGVAIVYVNSLLILSFLLPFSIRQRPFYQRLQLLIFLVANGAAIAVEMVDLAFFPYTSRRIISSDFDIIRTNRHLGAPLLQEYWGLALLYLSLMILLGYAYTKWTSEPKTLVGKWRSQILYGIGGLILFGLMARGGWQLRPLSPIYAGSYVQDKRLIPMVSNTTLNLLFSLQQKQLKDPAYFDPSEADRLFSTRQPGAVGPMRPENVVIIVLESFGKDYIGFYHPDSVSYTPFLDSLLAEGKQCQWSFANGMRSTKGIVAITAGIPSLMEDPLMFSAYQSNQVAGLAGLLGKKGYQSTFFHGANPGSMQFEKFCLLSGFDAYKDREAYGVDQDYDGQWGVWDVPYFQYVVDELSQHSNPFLGVLFSLTSHHPYKTEAWFEKAFANDPPKMRAVRYTDYALRKFFQKAQRQDWYDNTLFVITADHIGLISNPYYYSRTGRFEVPLLFFHPQHPWRDTFTNVAQQIDILPSVLDYLDYDLPYTSFGQSVFSPTKTGRAYAYLEGIYQYVNDDYVLNFDGERSLGMFDFRKDPHQRHNRADQFPKQAEEMEAHLRAVIQRHHRGMLFNELK